MRAPSCGAMEHGAGPPYGIVEILEQPQSAVTEDGKHEEGRQRREEPPSQPDNHADPNPRQRIDQQRGKKLESYKNIPFLDDDADEQSASKKEAKE